MNREDILRIAKECGFDELNPMGFFLTPMRVAIIERFANRMMAEGLDDEADLAIQHIDCSDVGDAEQNGHLYAHADFCRLRAQEIREGK